MSVLLSPSIHGDITYYGIDERIGSPQLTPLDDTKCMDIDSQDCFGQLTTEVDSMNATDRKTVSSKDCSFCITSL